MWWALCRKLNVTKDLGEVYRQNNTKRLSTIYKSIPKTLNTLYYFSVVGTLPLDFCLYRAHQWLLILTLWCLEIYLHHRRLIPGLDTWLDNPVGSFGGWLIKRRKGRLQFYILDEFCNVPDTPTMDFYSRFCAHPQLVLTKQKCCLHVSWYEAMVNLAGATMSNTSNLLSVEKSWTEFRSWSRLCVNYTVQ